MGATYLIDSNIAIYLLNGSLNEKALNFMKPIINDSYSLSVITKIELLGFTFSDAGKFSETQNFIDDGALIGLTDEVVTKTIELRQTFKIKPNRRTVPDAIIAATAMVFDLTLISRNDKDFKSITGLKYINPFE